jgi:hypothetical protein
MMGGWLPSETTTLVVVGSQIYAPQETDMDDIKQFIIANWKSAEALKTLLGAHFPKNDEFHFGETPTEQARLEVKNGKITRITTWSGLSWSAKYGYSSPVVDVF